MPFKFLYDITFFFGYSLFLSTKTFPTGWLWPCGAANRECWGIGGGVSVIISSSSTSNSSGYCSKTFDFLNHRTTVIRFCYLYVICNLMNSEKTKTTFLTRFLTFSFWVFWPLPLHLWSDLLRLHSPHWLGHLQNLKPQHNHEFTHL